MSTTNRMIDLDLAPSAPATTLSGYVHRAVLRLRTWARILKNRRAANRLLELEDHLLADIGLSVAEVHEVLRSHRLNEDPSMQLTLLARRRALRSLS